MLHITNGDSAGDTLRAFLSDPVTITCDVLHEGPVPMAPEWLAAAPNENDEVVLWFEHDLFDQLLLIRALDLVRDAGNVSLICIDRFPGVEPFYGLGQLNAEQLKSLFPTRKPVTAAQYEVASKAWNAFREPEPSALVTLTATQGALDALPFLRDALIRFFQEFPSTVNGLSRSQQCALDALAAQPMRMHDLFRETQRREERPFMGDLGFYDIIRELSSARVPLVTIAADTVTITVAGRDVRDGRKNAIAVNGVDQWRGGNHLTNSTGWRWDAGRQTLVSLSPR